MATISQAISSEVAAKNAASKIDPAKLADDIRAALAESYDQLEQGELRAMHDKAKQARLQESQGWIQRAWTKQSHRFADGDTITPENVTPRLVQVKSREQQDLFRLGRFTWSLPYSRGYGRRLRFLVIDDYHDALMGLLGLQSAPISFLARDQHMHYPSKERKEELVNQTMDIFTLGAIPPYNLLLGGKLMVYAAGSREVREAYREQYGDAVTIMRQRTIPAQLVLLTTTSAYGRSSIFNRVKYPSCVEDRTIAHQLGCIDREGYTKNKRNGYTKGYGNVHLDRIYPRIKEYLDQMGYETTKGYGQGPKPVWQNIHRALIKLEIDRSGLKHGIPREAWCIPMAKNVWEYLNGEAEEPDYYEDTFQEMADWWKERWLLPRSKRRDPDWPNWRDWKEWRKESVLESITTGE